MNYVIDWEMKELQETIRRSIKIIEADNKEFEKETVCGHVYACKFGCLSAEIKHIKNILRVLTKEMIEKGLIESYGEDQQT